MRDNYSLLGQSYELQTNLQWACEVDNLWDLDLDDIDSNRPKRTNGAKEVLLEKNSETNEPMCVSKRIRRPIHVGLISDEDDQIRKQMFKVQLMFLLSY